MKAKASTRRETQHLESFYPSEKNLAAHTFKKLLQIIFPSLLSSSRKWPKDVTHEAKTEGGEYFGRMPPTWGRRVSRRTRRFSSSQFRFFSARGLQSTSSPTGFLFFFYRSNGRCWWMRSSIVKKRSWPMKLFVFLELKRKTANLLARPWRAIRITYYGLNSH